jgi:hypothetical protein
VAFEISDLWNPQKEDAALLAVLDSLYDDAIEEAYKSANAVGVGVSLDLHNPRLAEFRASLAERVTGINQTTRDALQAVISEGMARGYSTKQMAEGVPADGYGGISGVFAEARGYRAQLIARTEASMTYNRASILAYRQSGRVQQVEVMDGIGDPICAAANGSIWDLDYAESMPLGHPACRRALVPIVTPRSA